MRFLYPEFCISLCEEANFTAVTVIANFTMNLALCTPPPPPPPPPTHTHTHTQQQRASDNVSATEPGTLHNTQMYHEMGILSPVFTTLD